MDKIFKCSDLKAVTESDTKSVYNLKNDTGEGVFTIYNILPGICIIYNDFHMQNYDSSFIPKNNLFAIDHCREGRLEYISGENTYSYIQSGDMKLDNRLSHTGRFEFPLSHYHGMTIGFDMDISCSSIKENIKDFPVDIKSMSKRYITSIYPFVIRSTDSLEHIFSEMYNIPEEIKIPYLRIKVYELLLCIDNMSFLSITEDKPYFKKYQVDRIKSIAQFLKDNLNRNFTQKELSEMFEISLTSLKNCFSSIFGISIGSWVAQCRMNYAVRLLKDNPQTNIIDIAYCCGYESPSKFAIAFKKVMNLSPSEYRLRNMTIRDYKDLTE